MHFKKSENRSFSSAGQEKNRTYNTTAGNSCGVALWVEFKFVQETKKKLGPLLEAWKLAEYKTVATWWPCSLVGFECCFSLWMRQLFWAKNILTTFTCSAVFGSCSLAFCCHFLLRTSITLERRTSRCNPTLPGNRNWGGGDYVCVQISSYTFHESYQNANEGYDMRHDISYILMSDAISAYDRMCDLFLPTALVFFN